MLGWLWTPLVAVTAAHDGRRSGQIAVSAHGASIVPERPRLTVALWKGNLTHDLALAGRAFAVHLLGAEQDELVFHLGLQSGRDLDKLATLAHEVGATGAPLLRDCLAVWECRLLNQMDGGDCTVFLGEVVSSAIHREGAPLWWRDLRPRLPAAEAARWDAKSRADIAHSLTVIDQIER